MKLLVYLILFKILIASSQEVNIQPRITGGYRPPKHTLAKHIVSITYKGYRKLGVYHFCGGSIIYPRGILTAAHCLWNRALDKKKNYKELQIVAGTPNRLKRTEHTQVIDVIHVLVHPDYKSGSVIDDIGALVLKNDIILDGVYAQRIPLINGPSKENQSCTAVGWGTIFDEGPHPAEVLYVDINILSREYCEREFENFTNCHICAADLRDLEMGVCSGDSGGPLICDGKVAGVASFGSDTCSDSFAFFSDVWYYREKFLTMWISGCQGKTTIKLMNIFLLKFLVWIVI